VTSDVIRSFNRDTLWLAVGVLGSVVFAALVLVVLEHQSKAVQGERDRLLYANPVWLQTVLAPAVK
jgi:hypothetical protein